ncbi:GGDEF domain-containing protein [Sedimentibacter sp.]|uniref:GGDEF domain-containing protein n=1 Tax=Sedimentibacter sp. TaxID=1960295 RepID=UPI0028A9E63A|nr:GGDEF domain-containing protein [Sedimentibacter sp.]
MNIVLFIKNNFIKLIIQISMILMIISLIISIFSVDFTLEIMHEDDKSIYYAGILRGETQRLIKQELEGIQNNELIEKLDGVIFQLNNNNQLVIHEEIELKKLLIIIETDWLVLKNELYNHRLGSDSKKLYYLSEDFFVLTDKLVIETQEYIYKKEIKLASIRKKLFSSIILILIFGIYQYFSKLVIQKENIELNNVVYIDALTGLFNRAYCNEIVKKYNKINNRPDLVCVYVDLNNLKDTNDLFGHEAGDKLIQDFSKILKDVSEPYGFICRNGGDEFVGIFENCTKENLNDYLNFLQEKVNKYNTLKNEIQISYAVGVAFLHEINSNKINDLLSLADKRMYKNKAECKGL